MPILKMAQSKKCNPIGGNRQKVWITSIEQISFIPSAGKIASVSQVFTCSCREKDKNIFGHIMLPRFTFGHFMVPDRLCSLVFPVQSRLRRGHFMLPAPAILWVK
jgi:hypothetical protein